MPLALYSFTLEMHLTPEGTLGDGEFLNTQDVWKLFPERGYVPAGADDNEGPSGGTEWTSRSSEMENHSEWVSERSSVY